MLATRWREANKFSIFRVAPFPLPPSDTRAGGTKGTNDVLSSLLSYAYSIPLPGYPTSRRAGPARLRTDQASRGGAPSQASLPGLCQPSDCLLCLPCF